MSQFYTAVKSIQEKPVLGLGADQFSYHVTDLKKKYDIWSKSYSGRLVRQSLILKRYKLRYKELSQDLSK